MEIRPLKDEDKNGICKLSHQINLDHFKNEPTYFREPVEEGSDWEFWKGSHEKEGGFILVAEISHEIVGFVAAEIFDNPSLPFLNPLKRCRIATIVVSKYHHRKGVGTALYENICKIANENGASDLSLEVFSFNSDAVAFYEKLGFRINSNRMSHTLA